MAAEFNRVIMMGRLTRDPELRHLDSGLAVGTLRLASNRTYTAGDGERREEVCYINVTVWNRLAEICSEYLTKGRQVLVEGRLRYDRWENAAGEPRSRHQIVANTIRFLDSPRGRDGVVVEEGAEYSVHSEDGGRHAEPSDEPIDDDIPF